VRGARGSITDVDDALEKLNQFCKERNCEAQMMDAGLVFGKAHILSAFEHAQRAFDEGRNSSRALATEVMLYASGERQISESIEKMGIKDGTAEFCIVLMGDADIKQLVNDMGLELDDSVLEGNGGNLGAFGITQEEMGTLPEENVFDLVLERVAMVDLLK
jgi:tRNA threonylcarbamoyladenosine modification (KEOPS) complex Cgi121 subunit